MGRASMSSQVMQLLGIGVPLLALALTLGVVYPSWGSYRALAARVEKQRQELQTLRAAPLPRRDPVVPAVEATEAEPSQFVGAIAALAAANQCELRGLDLQPSGGDTSAAGPIRPIRAKLTVTGHYIRIRALLADLNRAPRLYSVAELSLKSTAPASGQAAAALAVSTGRLDATLTIERYVMPPAVQTADASAVANRL